MMSFERTTTSAYLPGFSDPLEPSSNAANAPLMRVGLQRLHAAHALVGIEDAAVLQLPADGRVVARNRIDVFHRRVGAVGDDGAGLHQLLPDVRAFFGALRAEPRQHVRGVRRAVHALHRGNHAEGAEARNV